MLISVEATMLTGKDNKKERAAKGKEVAEMKAEQRFLTLNLCFIFIYLLYMISDDGYLGCRAESCGWFCPKVRMNFRQRSSRAVDA